MTLPQINNVCYVPVELELPNILYKYRSVDDRSIESVERNQIWLSPTEKFNDPFESFRIFSDTRFAMSLDRDVRESGVFCLCKSIDNLPMWSYYGAALKGFAVGYDRDILLRSLEVVQKAQNESGPRWRYVYDMAYSNDGHGLINEMAVLDTEEQRDREYQKIFACKAEAFCHEHECRIVVRASPTLPEYSPDHAWPGFGLYKHAPEAIKQIVFGELIGEADQARILRVLEGRGISFLQAIWAKNGFKIYVSPIDF